MSKQINQIAIFMVLLLVLTPFAFAEQLQIKKVSDLKPGDVIIDQKTGKEIPVESIQATDFKFMTNLLQIMTGKLPAVSMTGNVIAPITGKESFVTPEQYQAYLDSLKSSGQLGSGSNLPASTQALVDAEKAQINLVSGVENVPATGAANVPVGGALQGADAAGEFATTMPEGFVDSTWQGIAVNPETNSILAGGEVYQPVAGYEGVYGNLEGTSFIADGNEFASLAEVETAYPGAATAIPAAEPILGGTSATSKFVDKYFMGGKMVTGGVADTMFTGLQWAAVAYMAGQLLGPLFGLDKEQTNSLSLSLAAGAGTYGVLSTGSMFQTGTGFVGNLGANAGWIGIGVAAAIFILTYKDTRTEIVTFACEPWQAPTSKDGGTNCEVCNDDKLPCSEYRCKSLGQACELVNAGTGKEKCVYVNPKDVTPPVITPNPDDLPSSSYKYTNVKLSPPGPGFTVTYTNSSDGCIKAFTPLTFGITTDEPSQCKIDFNHTEKLTDMTYWMGGSNLYLYNHTEKFSLPGPANLKKENLTVENGGKWTFYLRCRDKNGNENAADYALRFCVDPTPDTTAPVVKATSIENGACVAANTQNASVSFYLNEPSTCRWSKTDQTYDLMQNNMSCSNRLEQMNAQQLYTCNTNLDSISRDGTEYFIRCKDNSDNKMATSYKFSLKGSNPLLIKTFKPNETVYGGVNPAPVELFVQTTFGCENNKAICAYSTTENLGDYVVFYDTNTEDGINTQKLFFSQGAKKVNVRCVDSGGNVANVSLNFNVEIDTVAPVVARVYEEDSLLKIVTVRDSECSFTNDDCSFLFEEGTEMPIANTTTHVTEWIKDKTYYIKCRDEFKNEEAGCSAIIRPVNNFL